MPRKIFILACLLLCISCSVSAKEYSLLTPSGSRLLAVVPNDGLYGASESISRMDGILKQQYLAKYSIAEERDVAMKNWLTTIAQLICSGNIIAAQILANEIKVSSESNTALPLLRRFANEATQTTDDALSIKAESDMNRIAVRFDHWKNADKECSTWMLKASMFGDKIALNYADGCFVVRDAQYKVAVNSAVEMRDIIARYRKGS